MRRMTAIAASAAAALAMTGCSSAVESTCQPGWIACGAECVLARTDPVNCGACGNVCGANQACVGGACVADCRSQLHAPIRDPWGYAWDGLERATAAHQAARQACLDLGGRLPTVSELYRVSAVRSAAVGDGYATHDLWALTPYDAVNSFRVALSDGVTDVVGNGTLHNFRCVCPVAPPAAFTEGACNGPIGESCFTLPKDPRYNLDAEDRPLLSKSGAIWECAFAGAQLASPERLASAISAGLVGSGAWVHTGDDSSYQSDTLVKWTGQPWSPAGNVTNAAATDLRPFRCIGPAADSATPVTASSSRFVASGTGVGADLLERPSGGFTGHLAACLEDGGHLPTSTEVASVAMQGLSRAAAAGDAYWLWTADQGGWDGAAWTAMAYSWSGVANWPGGPTPTTEALGYAYSTWLTWVYKNGVGRPSRCIYYPVDAAYALPAGACDLGCVEFARTRGADATVRVWIDDEDRPSAAFADAAKECAGRGGALASSRDLIEGIRNKLPGSVAAGLDVLTGDVVAGPNVYALRWTGTSNDTYQDSGGYQVALTAAARYRCVWTNEIR